MKLYHSAVFPMLLYRIGAGLLSMLLVTLVIFALVSFLPGSYAAAILGMGATPEAVAALEAKLGIDQPWLYRYASWLLSAVHGDLGTSFSGRPVTTVIATKLQNTLVLAGVTAALAVPLATFLGVISARYRNSLFDRILSSKSLALVSLPEFFLGYLVMLVFAIKLQWFPSMSSIRASMSFSEQFVRLVMPFLTLSMLIVAHVLRNTRAAVLGVMSNAYVEMSRLKGLPERSVVFREALPNAIGPIASVIALNLAYLISGVVVIEMVFVYPGIGQVMVDSVRNRDIPVIQAVSLIFSFAYISLNLVADIIAVVANPRLMHPR